jgi:hypothetical protein
VKDLRERREVETREAVVVGLVKDGKKNTKGLGTNNDCCQARASHGSADGTQQANSDVDRGQASEQFPETGLPKKAVETCRLFSV